MLKNFLGNKEKNLKNIKRLEDFESLFSPS